MQATTADRLRQIMNERNLRQVDIINLCQPFCEKFNLRLTKSDLSQFVHGKVTPGQWKISILSHALNVSEAWLMGYDVPSERQPDLTQAEVLEAFARGQESDIITIFRQLNPDGQKALKDFAEYLIKKPEFLLSPPAVSVS